MKRLFAFFLMLPVTCFCQQQSFDIISFTQPGGWKKEAGPSAVQLSQENTKDGSYCMITLFKSIPGVPNAKENFDAAWETVVREMVKVQAAPQMQPSAEEDGWEVQSGYAPFENDGQKGIALLVTSTGYEKMVNILVLTNTNAYESELSAFLESIRLTKPANGKPNTGNIGTRTGATTTTQTTLPPATRRDGFAFSTTHFDDGWTSTAQEDWVEVTKGNVKVLLHYPKQGTIFPADPGPLTNAAWDILVAPRYSNLKNYRTAYISTYNRPYLGMGTATDNRTGKNVYIVFFRQGDTGWLEFVTPDKNTFIQLFRFDPETIKWDSESSLMDPLVRMVSYNKFAIAASDFRGTWTSDFTGVQQLYYAYTGNYAGMKINQSNEEFVFGAGNTYNWKLLVVNGMVGNMNYNQVKSSGKFTVLNNWQVRFPKIEDKVKTFHAHWSCIKGARILNLLDANFPGSGIYTKFGIAK